ncbi:hypothetical protein [Saccharophagus degradans]|uniref:Uncharacterized protein n=1 Tax=Saccharophagus degradans (strain 2-40 / ATCC 43961 / DSM 17024) TaxID=203122 RepID=Q21FM7_SACD2|nr:hypothetical protein [Saccharophagus degradans]ABD82502.1 hypothetical protein Sde_3245 [Saccharophagus degradans 2-40]
MKFIITIIILLSAQSAFSYTQDSGEIHKVFIAASGGIAFTLSGGFPKAIEGNECPEGNGWAGTSSADPALKSAILAAKLAGANVTVTLEGCLGTWYKTKDIYIN